MSLEGKVAFVTGASGGIGAAVARSLVAAGAKVGLASRRGDDLGLGDAAYGLACDVSEHEEVDASVAATVERFGQLDIVVANAGVGAYGPFLELEPQFLEEMIDVNLKGTLYTVRAALPHLLESDAADIVTLASEAGRRGLPYEAVYCASKFGQVGFTRALDHELREQGVRCTNVCPGGVATEFALEEGRGRKPEALEGMDDRRRRGGDRHVRPDAAAQPPHPRDRDPPDDRDELGVGLATGACDQEVLALVHDRPAGRAEAVLEPADEGVVHLRAAFVVQRLQQRLARAESGRELRPVVLGVRLLEGRFAFLDLQVECVAELLLHVLGAPPVER